MVEVIEVALLVEGAFVDVVIIEIAVVVADEVIDVDDFIVLIFVKVLVFFVVVTANSPARRNIFNLKHLRALKCHS